MTCISVVNGTTQANVSATSDKKSWNPWSNELAMHSNNQSVTCSLGRNASRMFVNDWGVAHFQGYGTKPEDGYGITPINNQLYLLLICCVLRDCGHSEEMRSSIIETFGHTTRVTY